MGPGGGAGAAITLYAVAGVRGGLHAHPQVLCLMASRSLSTVSPPPPPQRGRKRTNAVCVLWGGPQYDRRGGEIKRTDGERKVKGRGVVVAFLDL